MINKEFERLIKLNININSRRVLELDIPGPCQVSLSGLQGAFFIQAAILLGTASPQSQVRIPSCTQMVRFRERGAADDCIALSHSARFARVGRQRRRSRRCRESDSRGLAQYGSA